MDVSSIQALVSLNLPKVSPVPTGQEGSESTATELSKVTVYLVKYHDTEKAFLTSILDRSE